MFSFFVILLLAWLFAPVFTAVLGVLALFLMPAVLAAIVRSLFPWIPFGLAYFGIMALLIFSIWKDRHGGEKSGRLQSLRQLRTYPRPDSTDGLTPSPRRRQVLTVEELEFVEGCRALAKGSDSEALEHFRKASRLADAAFLAGLVALKLDRPEEAAEYLSSIAEREHELDRYISMPEITLKVTLSITEEVSTTVEPDMRGVLLALSQAYMEAKRWRDARVQLDRLRTLDPSDTAARLAMVKWLLKVRPDEKESIEQVIRLAEDTEADSSLEAALLLDKARALGALGRYREARKAYDMLLCSAKVRHPKLLDAACRERRSLEEQTR